MLLLRMIRVGMALWATRTVMRASYAPLPVGSRTKKAPAARHGFLRSSGPDQQAHQQPEIVPRDVDQIALVDVLPAPQPCPAHPTAVQDVSEGALDEFRPVAQGLLTDF